jgi:uncharacterized repeat protein (TIGR03803 family)
MQIVLRNISYATRLRLLSGTLIPLLAFIIPCSAAAPTLKTLYSFTGGSDGAFPAAGLTASGTGVFYGTTYDGGAAGWGTVFQVSPPASQGAPWTEQVLYSFTGGSDGANPQGSLVLDKNGVLYGTTVQGGTTGYGTVFSLTPAGGGAWTQKTIYTFQGGNDGANPQAGLALSGTGVLYGTTNNGGTSGFGTVFQLVSVSGQWKEKVLYSFLGGNDGANPQASLAYSSATGVLYGTTYGGGVSGWGTVFQLIPSGGGVWTESLLYTFTGGADGGGPQAGVSIGKGNVLYGTTFWGGKTTACPLGGYPYGCGVVYQLAPPASPGGAWTQSVLYTFAGPPKDGAHPIENLAIGGSGGLLGTAFTGASSINICFPVSYTGCGMVYQLKPPSTPGGAWTKNPMVIFNGNNGGGPNNVILGAGGISYGTTSIGGTSGGYGTVFQVVP